MEKKLTYLRQTRYFIEVLNVNSNTEIIGVIQKATKIVNNEIRNKNMNNIYI